MIQKAQLLPNLAELMETTMPPASLISSARSLSGDDHANPVTVTSPLIAAADASLSHKGTLPTCDKNAAAAADSTRTALSTESRLGAKRPPVGGKDFLIASRCGVMNMGSMLIRTSEWSKGLIKELIKLQLAPPGDDTLVPSFDNDHDHHYYV